jgi:hypothetical protein
MGAGMQRRRLEMPAQNGIRRPEPDTLGGHAWALFDEMGASASNADVIAKGVARGLNGDCVRTELSRWRKFSGIPPLRRKLISSGRFP